MNRSIGVTVNAVIALVASVLALAFGVLMVFAMVLATSSAPLEPPKEFPLPPVLLKAFMLLIPLMYLLPAIWGICTAIGLLRLKNWARISIIVFGGLLAAFGLLGALSALAFTMVRLPDSPAVDPAAMGFVRAFMALFALGELGTGLWWLVFFNLAKTKAQFQRRPATFAGAMPPAVLPPPPPRLAPLPTVAPLPARPEAPTRPISITIIACYLLIMCAFVPTSLVLHSPAPLFTVLLTGWGASLYYLVVLAVQVYVGIGLLRMQPAARLAGMGYFAFTLFSSAAFYFAPGGHARVTKLMASQLSMFPWMKAWQDATPLQLDLAPFLMAGAVLGLAVVLVPLYFLFISGPAFERRGSAAAG